MATLSVRYVGDADRQLGARLSVVSTYDLWWRADAYDQPSLMPSTVRLSNEFFDEVTNHPVLPCCSAPGDRSRPSLCRGDSVGFSTGATRLA